MINETLEALFVTFTSLIIIYMARHYVFTIAVLYRPSKAPKITQTVSYEPTVSVLVPAHNERPVIARLIEAMTKLNYPKNKLQILIVDDASTDGTGEIADQYPERFPFVHVLHRDTAIGGKGKASALNAGFAHAYGEIILCFDADYLPHQDLVTKLVAPFQDPTVGAVQGRPVVMNEPQNLLTRLIALERMGGYRVDQEARERLGLVPQFGGTVGGFRNSLLKQLGGFDEKMLTEDTDLTFQIRLAGYKIRYVHDAECYEEAVDTWKAYWRQRHRWARGHMQVCFKHTLGVLKSKNLVFKEKLDGLLLLYVYFMPIIALLCLALGAYFTLHKPSPLVDVLWFMVPLSLYSFVGNFAPFFEVSIGAYLDGRSRAQWLVPLLIFAFVYNILICTKAFLDIAVSTFFRRSQRNWAKTAHQDNGTKFVVHTTQLGVSPL